MNIIEAETHTPTRLHELKQSPKETTFFASDTETEIAVCITLYNEEFDELKNTLASISRSKRTCIDSGRSIQGLKVFIIADGADKLSASFYLSASELGWLEEAPPNNKNKSEHNVYRKKIKPRELCFLGSNISDDFNEYAPLETYFFIKNRNKGKLHSHTLFFGEICIEHDPQYCFQIDAGTILCNSALNETLKKFEEDSSNAAIASNVLIPVETPSNMLECYQCADFVIQRSILWPAENLCGYMSVVPGQFCGVNWHSLSLATDESSSPLTRYLSGNDGTSASTTIMYLAEDRVMGFELYTNKGSDYQLTYAPQAQCYTDPCNTLEELLEQRRRWINSSFTCRTWAASNIGRYFKNSSASRLKKAKAISSILSMLWSHFMEYFIPLVCLLILTFTLVSVDVIADHYVHSSAYATSAFILLLLAWLSPSFLALSGVHRKLNSKLINTLMYFSAIGGGATIVVNYLGYYLSGGSVYSPIIYAPILIATLTCFSSACISRKNLELSIKTIIPYVMCSGPINLMLSTYAFTNLSDTSWGTKGLTKKNNSDNKQNKLQKSLKLYAGVFVSMWISINLLAYLYILHAGVVYQAICVFAILFLAYAIIGTIGSLFLWRSKRKGEQIHPKN